MASIKTIFTNIANAIRTKKGTSAKYLPENMAEEISTIETGIIPTGKIEITNTEEINVTNYETAQVVDSNLSAENIKEGVSILGKVGTFKGGSGESTLKKLLDTTKTTKDLFYNYKGTSVDDLIQYSDTENVTEINGMFSYCPNLQSIPKLDTSKALRAQYLCYDCKCLITIEQLNFINIANSSEMFYNCQALTNLTLLNIKKVNLTIGSGTSYGHLLTLDSLINTIKELVNTGASRKLTMGSANLEKIANVYVRRTTTGDIPTCWNNNSNIDLAKGPCEVCESTDEGAMRLEDYANLKGWELQ